MNGIWKKIIISAVVLICAFAASFFLCYYAIILPQYKYLTEEKVFEEIKSLKEEVMLREQQIVTLETELEIYRKIAQENDLEIELDAE